MKRLTIGCISLVSSSMLLGACSGRDAAGQEEAAKAKVAAAKEKTAEKVDAAKEELRYEAFLYAWILSTSTPRDMEVSFYDTAKKKR